MRMTMNEVTISGHLTKDVEFNEDDVRAKVSICDDVLDYYDEKTEKWIDVPNFNSVIANGKVAKSFRHGKKGDFVSIKGPMVSRSYDDGSGNKTNITFVSLRWHSPFIPKSVYSEQYKSRRETEEEVDKGSSIIKQENLGENVLNPEALKLIIQQLIQAQPGVLESSFQDSAPKDEFKVESLVGQANEEIGMSDIIVKI